MTEAPEQELIRDVARLVRRTWPTRLNDKETFTEDQLIEVWSLGRNDFLRQFNDTLKRVLEENIRSVVSVRDELVGFMRGRGFDAQRAYLNVESYDSLKILFTVPLQNYCSEGFLAVLRESAKEEARVRRERTLDLSIEYMSESGDIDEEALLSDGYVWPQFLFAA